MRRWLVFPAAAVISITVMTAVPAAAVTPLVRVSGPSPMSACRVPLVGGVRYRNAEVEPDVAASAAQPGNLIGVWQQDRFSNGGAAGLVAGYSSNSGRTWGEVSLPFSKCVPGGLNYDRASDPVVSIGPDGRAYSVALSFTPNNIAPNFTTVDAIAAATSTDGGRSWPRVRVLDQDTNGDVQGSLDKEWVVADPARAGIAYVTWDHFTPNPDGRTFHVPARFSRTTDGGLTWSGPRTIAAIPADEAAEIDTPVVDPRSGAIYVFFVWSTPGNPPRLAFVRSTNGGVDWSAPRAIINVGAVGVTDPATGRRLRTGDSLFSVAINPLTGRLYLAWQSARFSSGRFDESLLTTSADGARTWTSPEVVSTRYGGPAFLPTVAVNSAGQVGLIWYDFRHDDPATPQLTTDVWFRTLDATATQTSDDQDLSGPFNFEVAPHAGGLFVGDYQGVTAVGSSFHPFFATTNCLAGCTANPTDIYTTGVEPAAPTNPVKAIPLVGRLPGSAGPPIVRRVAPIR
jgi:hypothetical protein